MGTERLLIIMHSSFLPRTPTSRWARLDRTCEEDRITTPHALWLRRFAMRRRASHARMRFFRLWKAAPRGSVASRAHWLWSRQAHRVARRTVTVFVAQAATSIHHNSWKENIHWKRTFAQLVG